VNATLNLTMPKRLRLPRTVCAGLLQAVVAAAVAPCALALIGACTQPTPAARIATVPLDAAASASSPGGASTATADSGAPYLRDHMRALAARDPHATALCKELYPCSPQPPEREPDMCALAGQRIGPTEHVPGLSIEHLSCPFSRAGLDAIVGVPDDGSRPLLQNDALRARVRGVPRLRALTADVGDVDETACPVTEDAGLVRFCVRGVSFKQRFRCAISSNDSVGCAQEGPERYLRLCQERHPKARVVGKERYWGPGYCAVPSDHVRNGQVQGELPAQRGTSALGEIATIVLRAGGKEVRVLTCAADEDKGASSDDYLIDGDATTVTEAELLRRLDDDVMRAALIAQHLQGSEWAVLLDPSGGREPVWPMNGTCALPRGPRRVGKVLEFMMTPSIANRPSVLCRADVSTWSGACTPVPAGSFCE